MQETSCCAYPSALEQVRASMPAQEDIAALAEFFRTIGSDTRLKILLALDGRELCAGHLAESVGMAPSAVSNQLKALRQARLITVRREGKQLYYRLADCHPREIIHLGMGHIREDASPLHNTINEV
ncbi:MAG: winged helix-turn-helix transcriptional regulator [Clostridia bacterium]|nr:winged helix-turn-helix transcriptional regulator [Clostridia bacterium]